MGKPHDKGNGQNRMHMSDNHRDEQRWKGLLPEFAPLPAPFVHLLFEYPDRFDFTAFPYNPQAPLFERLWVNTHTSRSNVFCYVLSVVLAERSGALDNRLSITWFHKAMERFDPLHQVSSRAKVTNWQTRKLLRTREFGVPEPNSASAALIMRSLSSWRRAWLPSEMDAGEPWFWVWGQQPGETEPRMYPLPLPPQTPANTLLWSSWPGAGWLPGWQMVREYGAISWAKTIQVRGQTLWNLSADEMAAWDADFVKKRQLDRQPPTALPGLQAAYGIDNEPYMLAKLHAAADDLLFLHGEALLFQTLERYYAKRLPPDFPSPTENGVSAIEPAH